MTRDRASLCFALMLTLAIPRESSFAQETARATTYEESRTAGAITFADGTTKKFVSIAGIARIPMPLLMPGTLAFLDFTARLNEPKEYVLPLKSVAKIRITQIEKGLRGLTIDVTGLNGTTQTTKCGCVFTIDVRWEGSIMIQRFEEGALYGAEITMNHRPTK